MIRLFIYQTYNSYKLDKKKQSIYKDNLNLDEWTKLLHYNKNVLILVHMYY